MSACLNRNGESLSADEMGVGDSPGYQPEHNQAADDSYSVSEQRMKMSLDREGSHT